MKSRQLADARGSKSGSPAEKLVQHEAQRVNVGLHRRRAAREQLRRHVGRRAGHMVISLLSKAGETKVGDHSVAFSINHHVRRLQVPMQDALRVRSGQPCTQLACDADRIVRGETPDPPQQRCEVFSVDVLHRKKQLAVGFAGVVDAADVGMRDLPGGSYLAEQLLAAFRASRYRCRQELQRDFLREREVLDAIHLAHASASQEGDDAIAVSEQGAGCETAPARRGRARGGARRSLGQR